VECFAGSRLKGSYVEIISCDLQAKQRLLQLEVSKGESRKNKRFGLENHENVLPPDGTIPHE
jgi:hypothetical protein